MQIYLMLIVDIYKCFKYLFNLIKLIKLIIMSKILRIHL